MTMFHPNEHGYFSLSFVGECLSPVPEKTISLG